MKSFFDLPENLQEKIAMCPISGCWIWTAFLTPKNYGWATRPHNGKKHAQGLAHRVVYEILIGPIPAGDTLDHLCRNRPCCNPQHMEPVSPVENWRRGFGPCAVHARKTHCIRGHEFTAENTYYGRSKYNGNLNRTCKTCRSATMARFLAKKKTPPDNQGIAKLAADSEQE